MFGRRLPLIRLLGFEIRFDLTWLILVALIIWTLSAGYFPATYADLSRATYFWMAVLGAIGVIASIVVHELAHSVVARRFGIEIHGITLFAFGGAAEMVSEPPTPKAEFWMAAAGPITSLAIAALFWLIAIVLQAAGTPEPFIAVLAYLSGINIILAIFNLVPGFPLDGGRMLRAILWWWKRDLHWATRVAAAVGGGFGLGLVLLGLLNVLSGNLVGGLWMFLIGLFLRAAASSSYQALVTREALSGIPASQLMTRQPVTVLPDTRITDLIEEYFLGRYLKFVPVTSGDRLLGFVDVRAAKAVPREEWPHRHIDDIMTPASPDNTIRPDTDAATALEQMQRTGNSRLLVVESDRLMGILALKDMMRVIGLRSDFEDLRPSGGSTDKTWHSGYGRA
jgi:Zn-dependent protease/predicted transcriptional regulator